MPSRVASAKPPSWVLISSEPLFASSSFAIARVKLVSAAAGGGAVKRAASPSSMAAARVKSLRPAAGGLDGSSAAGSIRHSAGSWSQVVVAMVIGGSDWFEHPD